MRLTSLRAGPVPWLKKYFKHQPKAQQIWPHEPGQPRPKTSDLFIPRMPVDMRGRHMIRRAPNSSGRQELLKKLLVGLFRYERIEAMWIHVTEVAPYVDYLVQDAIRFGPRHVPTMELLDHWLPEKDLIRKVFDVYAERYRPLCQQQAEAAAYLPPKEPFTRLHRLPTRVDLARQGQPWGVVEMSGNPFPPIPTRTSRSGRAHHRVYKSLANSLLAAARHDFYRRHPRFIEEFQAKKEEEEVVVESSSISAESTANLQQATSSDDVEKIA